MPIQWMTEADDIFESGADAIVIPVNCVGSLGAGLALEAKKRFPPKMGAKGLEAIYKELCAGYGIAPGHVYPLLQEHTGYAAPHIYLFTTKRHWRNGSLLSWIGQGLESLRGWVDTAHRIGKLESIAIPALGCGLGGQKWSDVRLLIEEAFKDCAATIYVYPPRKEG